MATEVLYPHDVLAQRLRPHASAFAPRRKPHPHNPHSRSNNLCNINPSSSSSNIGSSTCRSSSSSNPRPPRKVPADQKRRREGSGSPPPKAHQQQLQLQLQLQQVTVLRRGESLDSALAGSRPSLPRKQGPPTTGPLSSARGGDLMTSSKPRPAGDDVYAGSAFAVSPAPSDLPLPSFFSARKEERAPTPPPAFLDEASVDHSATKDLRRLLRLQQ